MAVYYGASDGLSAGEEELFVDSGREVTNRFGEALAYGDFDGDGYDDLAIGVPHEDIGVTDNAAGKVRVLYGDEHSGLSNSRAQEFYRGHGLLGSPTADERLGQALAAGDFDADGRDDLAIGVPGMGDDAGAVIVIWGTDAGLSGDEEMELRQGQPSDHGGTVDGSFEAGDRFGAALASADFDLDGYADLAVGSPWEDVDGDDAVGVVQILFGSDDGLDGALDRDQLFHQDSGAIPGGNEPWDHFGGALATGDFNADACPDLAVGVPGEGVGDVWDAGLVNVIHSDCDGLDINDAQMFHQSPPSSAAEEDILQELLDWVIDTYNDVTGQSEDGYLQGTAEGGDLLGAALLARDFARAREDDQAAGAPRENIGAKADAGLVNLIYGSPYGLSSTGDVYLYQDQESIHGGSEAGDSFGAALAAGDFDGDALMDLVIGAPGEDNEDAGVDDAGIAHILYAASPHDEEYVQGVEAALNLGDGLFGSRKRW